MWPIWGLELEMVIRAVCAFYPRVTGDPSLTGRRRTFYTGCNRRKCKIWPRVHYKCRLNSVCDKNRNHCDISSFCATVFAYPVRFGLLADIYLLYSVFPINLWPLEDVLYEVLCWHMVAACIMSAMGTFSKTQRTFAEHPPGKLYSLHMYPFVLNT